MHEYLSVTSLMMGEVEQLRGLGVRCSAALGLVAERHRFDVEVLRATHFAWLMLEAGAEPAAFVTQ